MSFAKPKGKRTDADASAPTPPPPFVGARFAAGSCPPVTLRLRVQSACSELHSTLATALKGQAKPSLSPRSAPQRLTRDDSLTMRF